MFSNNFSRRTYEHDPSTCSCYMGCKSRLSNYQRGIPKRSLDFSNKNFYTFEEPLYSPSHENLPENFHLENTFTKENEYNANPFCQEKFMKIYEDNAKMKNEIERLRKIIQVYDMELEKYEEQIRESGITTGSSSFHSSGKKENNFIASQETQQRLVDQQKLIDEVILENKKLKEQINELNKITFDQKQQLESFSEINNSQKIQIEKLSHINMAQKDQINSLNRINQENEAVATIPFLSSDNGANYSFDTLKSTKETNMIISKQELDIQILTDQISKYKAIISDNQRLYPIILSRVKAFKNEIEEIKKSIIHQMNIFNQENNTSLLSLLKNLQILSFEQDKTQTQQALNDASLKKQLIIQFQTTEKCQNENKKLLSIHQDDLSRIKELNKEKENLELENKNLESQLTKLRIKLEVFQEALSQNKLTKIK